MVFYLLLLELDLYRSEYTVVVSHVALMLNLMLIELCVYIVLLNGQNVLQGSATLFQATHTAG